MTGELDRPEVPKLVLFTGPPGTGKSTLADHAAKMLAAPVLGWDWAMAALTEFPTIQDAIRELSHLEHRRVGWSLLWNIATAQLRRGSSVILDGVARDAEIDGCRGLAERENTEFHIVVTSCSDQGTHRQRVEGRRRGIPGWHELDWDHVARLLENWSPPPDADLYLDASDLLEENAARVTAMLSKSCDNPPTDDPRGVPGQQ